MAQIRQIALGCFRSSGRSPRLTSGISHHAPGDLSQVRTSHSLCGQEEAELVVAHNPASLLADVGVSRPQARIPSRLRRHPCRRARRPAALAAAIGTLGEARPIGGMVLKQLVGVDTDCPPGVRRTLEAGQCGTSVRGLTLARRASAHQASAGRWTAAGDHAPIVERSIANQQQPHHHHQADPWMLPRQPAPKVLSVPKNQATHPSLPSRLAT